MLYQNVSYEANISSHSSLKSERELKELREDIEKKSQPIDPFDGLTLVDDSLKCLVGEPAQLEPLRTWLGHMIMETYGDDESYLSARSRLSDAAYWGRWKEFWEALSVGNNVYAESWINATRLSESIFCGWDNTRSSADEYCHRTPEVCK